MRHGINRRRQRYDTSKPISKGINSNTVHCYCCQVPATNCGKRHPGANGKVRWVAGNPTRTGRRAPGTGSAR